MRRTPTLRGVVTTLLLLLLAVVVCGNSWGIFQTDIKPETYLAPGRMLGTYLSAWLSDPYLGQPNFNVGLAPVLVVTALLRAIGLDAEWTFKLFHLALWAVAAWGANRLLRRLAPKAGPWAGLAAGVAYLANPYTISAGSTLAIALPLALLPWQALCLVRALHHPRSWAWPALFGLVFAAMSGMNVAVVPLYQLVLVIPLAIVVGRERGVGWARSCAVVGKCALFVVGLSLYWLIPGVGAASAGTQVIAQSETLAGIAKVSSLPEVLRGVGMWSIYGHGPNGPWVPQFSTYLSSPVMVLLGILWPVLALVALTIVPRTLRRVTAGGIALAAVLMVGLFPAAGSSPVGGVLAWLFQDVPVLAAFRTTNKVGAVLTLCFALLLGYAAPLALRRLWRVPAAAPVAVNLVLVLLVSWSLPALTGNLYVSPMKVPGYWTTAAGVINDSTHDSRVLLVPGQYRPDYRWTVDRPDDVTNSLFSKGAIIPETTPNTSAWGANYLAALDDSVQSGQAPSGSLSTMARYLGADQVLARHDVVWENTGGARPGVIESSINADDGLTGVANFGEPGQNVGAPGIAAMSPAEAQLPPLQMYAVTSPRATVRAEPVAGSVIVAGDGWSVPAMSGAGLLAEGPMFRYATDLSGDDMPSALSTTGRVVLTDSNRRREVIPNRLTAGHGELLEAAAPVKATRALGGAADQTTLVTEGARALASSTGAAFFAQPYASASNVLDGDPATSWRFGDFQRAVGMHVDITLPETRTLDHLTITQTPIGPVQIAEVTVTAGGRTVTSALPESAPQRIDLGEVAASTVRVTVTALRGNGFNAVGISDIAIPGVTSQPVAQLPDTLTRAYDRLSAAEQKRFDELPFDVLLTRAMNAAGADDDEERVLARNFNLPDARTFDIGASVRLSRSVDEVTLDHLAGLDPAIEVRSSGTWFDNPALRASAAVDGDTGTAWVPGGPLIGSWWEITGPSRPITAIEVTQALGSPEASALATGVDVLVDGRSITHARLTPTTTRLALPEEVTGQTVRLVITDQSGAADSVPPRFTSIDTGLLPHPGTPPCVEVATVDGLPLLMRASVGAVLGGRDHPGARFEQCQPLALARGDHTIRPVPGYVLDRLNLLDTTATAPTSTAPTATASARGAATVSTTGRTTAQTVTVTNTEPVALVLGQGYDRGWSASIDGQDLGAPIVVDGFSTGWIIDTPGTHEVSVRYQGQRAADAALVTSSLVALVAAVLVGHALLARRRRLTGHDDEDPAAPLAADPAALDSALPGAPASALWARRTRRSLVLLVVGTAAFWWAGFAGALLAVALGSVRNLPRWVPTVLGAGLILTAGVTQVLLTRDLWGTVDADGVARSLWPHHLAAVGLVLALAQAWRRGGRPGRSEEGG